jgi:hypothetical protein
VKRRVCRNLSTGDERSNTPAVNDFIDKADFPTRFDMAFDVAKTVRARPVPFRSLSLPSTPFPPRASALVTAHRCIRLSRIGARPCTSVHTPLSHIGARPCTSVHTTCWRIGACPCTSVHTVLSRIGARPCASAHTIFFAHRRPSLCIGTYRIFRASALVPAHRRIQIFIRASAQVHAHRRTVPVSRFGVRVRACAHTHTCA